MVEQNWTPITTKSASEVVIYLACSSNIFFLSFLAFQRPFPLHGTQADLFTVHLIGHKSQAQLDLFWNKLPNRVGVKRGSSCKMQGTVNVASRGPQEVVLRQVWARLRIRISPRTTSIERYLGSLTPSTQSNLFPILICFFLILIRIPFHKPI